MSCSSLVCVQRPSVTLALGSNAARSTRRSALPSKVVCSARHLDGAGKDANEGGVLKRATGLAVAGLVAAAVVGMTPAGALAGGIDTSTFKAGEAATIEYSDITNEDAREVVRKLSEEVLPVVKRELAEAASRDGGNYSASVVQELETVQDEINTLVKQAKDGGNPSNVKSLASGIEQQVNALKAILGFD